jgi:hypothetical protein
LSIFQSGANAGFINTIEVAVTDAPPPLPATVQMRVWDNKGGTITDWATALAQPPGTEILGMSELINLPYTGYGLGNLPGYMEGLRSFNLTYNVPEPSPFALAGFGAFLLWLLSAARKRLPNSPKSAAA